ncbi:MAG: hypothetical protein ACTHK5_02175 [Tsuneonella sp.]
MDTDQVIRSLSSPSLGVRTAATYSLDYGDFCDTRIRNAVRANLNTDDVELLEITIMRLLIRGKDAQSADRVRKVLATFHGDLVFCAAVGALTNLANDFPQTANATLTAFDALPRSNVPADRRAMFDKARAELRGIGP